MNGVISKRSSSMRRPRRQSSGPRRYWAKTVVGRRSRANNTRAYLRMWPPDESLQLAVGGWQEKKRALPTANCKLPTPPRYNPRTMKIATWNVNGIRARHEQFPQWVSSAQPDVICLQEIKARLDQIPQSCSIEGYTCYWHGAGGYSGVGLHIRRDFADNIAFTHPDFDHETRIVEAQIEDTVFTSVYVPNGGKDFDAKIAFIHSLTGYAAGIRARGLKLVL